MRGRLYELCERAFGGLLNFYERGLDVVLKFLLITLIVFLATVALSAYLFMIIPKGFFPQQDTGLLTGIAEAAQDVSFPEMMRLEEQLGTIIQQNPAVDHVARSIGGAGTAAHTPRWVTP